MKKRVSLLLAAAMTLTALTGCSSGNDTTLVSKTPFPEFSEVDTEGNQVSSDIFADYDATIVNFWNNGCGNWRSCTTSFRSRISISSVWAPTPERGRNRWRLPETF